MSTPYDAPYKRAQQVARSFFLRIPRKGDRDAGNREILLRHAVVSYPGGNRAWWPELGPLTRVERAFVRGKVGLSA